jgi:hypothetical protein
MKDWTNALPHALIIHHSGLTDMVALALTAKAHFRKRQSLQNALNGSGNENLIKNVRDIRGLAQGQAWHLWEGVFAWLPSRTTKY